MLLHSYKIILVVVISVLIHTPAWANGEHSELTRLLIELKSLERIIVIAEHSANKQNRLTFDYGQLRSDLRMIQQGIEDYVNTIPRDPRTLPNIKADY